MNTALRLYIWVDASTVFSVRLRLRENPASPDKVTEDAGLSGWDDITYLLTHVGQQGRAQKRSYLNSNTAPERDQKNGSETSRGFGLAHTILVFSGVIFFNIKNL